MALKFEDGDYIPDELGGFKTVSGEDAVRQRIIMKLTAKRGAFPLMENFGSRLYLLSREKPSDRVRAAQQYISEALEDEDVSVNDVTVTESDGVLKIAVTITADGETFETSLTV